jgi:hypothetical protein
MAEELLLTTMDAQVLIKEFGETEKSPVEMIPDDISAEQLQHYCNVLGNGYAHAQGFVTKLKPYLGRVFLLYKQHPQLYKELGYETYSDWMSVGVSKKFGISRPEAFKCVMVAEELGHAPSESLVSIGPVKQVLIAKAIRNDNSSTVEMKREKADKWIAQAESMTADQLADTLFSKGLVDDKDAFPPVYIKIRTTEENKKIWEGFRDSKEVHEFCKTSDEGDLFGILLSETAKEIFSQIEDGKKTTAKRRKSKPEPEPERKPEPVTEPFIEPI